MQYNTTATPTPNSDLPLFATLYKEKSKPLKTEEITLIRGREGQYTQLMMQRVILFKKAIITGRWATEIETGYDPDGENPFTVETFRSWVAEWETWVKEKYDDHTEDFKAIAWNIWKRFHFSDLHIPRVIIEECFEGFELEVYKPTLNWTE